MPPLQARVLTTSLVSLYPKVHRRGYSFSTLRFTCLQQNNSTTHGEYARLTIPARLSCIILVSVLSSANSYVSGHGITTEQRIERSYYRRYTRMKMDYNRSQ